MGIVTNQGVAAGDELCISYTGIENDVLCKSAFRRNGMPRMSFDDSFVGDSVVDSGDSGTDKEEEGPEVPVVDVEVQNEFAEMDPFESLSAVEEMIKRTVGAKLPEDSLRR
jgi:hypothetical protein